MRELIQLYCQLGGTGRLHVFIHFEMGMEGWARLVQDYILLRRNYVPSPLFAEDRQGQYYDALDAADQGEPAPLVELLAKNILRVADRYLSAIREDSEKEDWIGKITKVATERVRATGYRRFIRWERQVRVLMTEFQQIGTELRERIPDFIIRFKDYQGVTYDKHDALRRTGRAEKTWAFGLEFMYEHSRLRFVFWLATHLIRGYDPEPDMTEDPVLLVSMEDQTGYYQNLDTLQESMISLREVLLHRRGGLARRCHDPARDTDRWEFGILPGQIVRDFFTEVLQKLAVI